MKKRRNITKKELSNIFEPRVSMKVTTSYHTYVLLRYNTYQMRIDPTSLGACSLKETSQVLYFTKFYQSLISNQQFIAIFIYKIQSFHSRSRPPRYILQKLCSYWRRYCSRSQYFKTLNLLLKRHERRQQYNLGTSRMF